MATWFGDASWFSHLGLSQAEFMANPYPVYQEWRETHPIWRVADGHYLILDYAAVREVFQDGRFIKGATNGTMPAPAEYRHLPLIEPSMLMSDPPAHTRLRGLVNQAFQPRHLTRLAPYIEATAEALWQKIRAEGGGDFVADFAFPLPALVIAELLGVPKSDQPKFRSWSQRIAKILDPSQSPTARQDGVAARWELLDYFHRLIETKRTQKGNDLLSELIQAEEAGDRLSPGELLSTALLLLVAGHETTTNLLSMGTLALITEEAEEPTDWARAVEELLRFTSPVQIDARMARESLTLGGVEIPEGSRVTLVIGSANHDPAVFSRPDGLWWDRPSNPHMAFGRGIHFCLGAGLARLEAGIGFPLVWGSEKPRLAGLPVWNSNIVLRGLSTLPIRL